MKLFRYLSREVFSLLLAITLILLIIFLSNEWFRHISRVVAGRLSMAMMAELLLLSLPQLLGVLLPLGFFFALLIAYGRLYADNEMTVMFASGLSPVKLSIYTLVMACIVAIFAGTISLGVAPNIEVKRQQIMRQGGLALMVDLLLPGRFQTIDKHGTAVYVAATDNEKLRGIFIARRLPQKKQWDIVSAERGEIIEPDSGLRQLVLYQGQRYQGVLGQGDFYTTSFSELSFPLTKKQRSMPVNVKSRSSIYLWRHYHDSLGNSAELQWRLSIPMMAFILALISVPLSRVSPRQGRYAKIFPATLIIVVYANLLFFIRSWVKHGSFPVDIGLWGLHIAFLFVAAIIWWWPNSRLKSRLSI